MKDKIMIMVNFRSIIVAIFFIYGACVCCSAPAWSSDAVQDTAVAVALDAEEAGPFLDQAVSTAAASEVKEAYVAQEVHDYFTPPVERKESFDAGYEVYAYDFQENANGAKAFKNQGTYSGYFLDCIYRPELTREEFGLDEYRLEARLAGGLVDYGGSYDSVRDRMFELRGLTGRRFTLWGRIVSTPYFGLGYRYLFDKGSMMPESASHLSGFDQESRYWYLPLGINVRSQIKKGWALGLNLEYDRLIWGGVTAHLEQVKDSTGVNLGLGESKNDQKSGYGVRGALKLSREFKNKKNVFVEPFYRYWNVGNSNRRTVTQNGQSVCNSNGICNVPQNWTQEIGLKMGVGF